MIAREKEEKGSIGEAAGQGSEAGVQHDRAKRGER